MTGPLTNPTAPPRRTWSPWRVVVGFGTISLAGGSAVCTAGLVTFGLVGFHLVDARIVPAARPGRW